MSGWGIVGVVAVAIGITVLGNWLAVGLRRPTWPGLPHGVSWALTRRAGASLIWILLVSVAGILAVRYGERISNVTARYLFVAACGLVAFGLSVLRARLYRPLEARLQARPAADGTWKVANLLHDASYLLLATVLYLILALLSGQTAHPILWIPLWLGALLPDLDSQRSLLGQIVPSISRRLEARFGHQQEWHTPAVAAVIGLVTLPIAFLWGGQAWYLIPLGYVSHLALDLLSPQGVMLLWPATRARYRLHTRLAQVCSRVGERWLAAGLAAVLVVLVVVVDWRPQPVVVALPTYEESVNQYYGLRGRYLAFADIDGTWQATGRPVSGWFEIVSAADQTLILLDRYTGRILAAGRDAGVDVYLNRIRVVAGSAVQIKAIELHLAGQPLADALPQIYQMQQEPGLQHILISGDIVVSSTGSQLQQDYTQTGVPKIQAHEDGHDSLQYLTAADLIALGNVQVANGDLVVVATYVTPAAGPTATPLPSPPPLSEEGQ